MAIRRALLVHNSRFTDPDLHPLPAADADVARLKALLLEDYVGFAPENVVTLANPSLTDFRMAVSRLFRDAEADDYLFFYYAGHGIRSETGDLYLALRNTRVSDFEAMSLEAGFIRRALSRCLSQKKIVVLDCCNAGAFRLSGNMVARDAAYDPGLISGNFDPKGTGTYVLGASQSGASAYETVGEDGQPYSLFTDAFIRGVETGAAAPGAPVINMIDISRYIHGQRNAKGQATQPYIDVTNSVGLLEFSQNPQARSQGAMASKTPQRSEDLANDLAHPVNARTVTAAPKKRRALGRLLTGVAAISICALALVYVLRPNVPAGVENNLPQDPPSSASVTIPPAPSDRPPEPNEAAPRMLNTSPVEPELKAAAQVENPPPPEPVPAVTENIPSHAALCAANPQLDLDLSDLQNWQGPAGQMPELTQVLEKPAAWDAAMTWVSLSADAITDAPQVLAAAVLFCSCRAEDAHAVIRKLRVDNGIFVALDEDAEAINFGTPDEIDMFSAKASPFSAVLKSHKSGQRTLTLKAENKRADSPLGFAIEGRLQAAHAYAGRCRD